MRWTCASRRWLGRCWVLGAGLAACTGTGAAPDSGPGAADGVDGTGDTPALDWQILVDNDEAGAWLSAWGTSQDDVWVGGGQPEEGAIRRGPIDDLQRVSLPVSVPLLNWVHGTGPDDVWVGGIQGTVLHWDGAAWSDWSLDIDEAIWGIYARSPTEVYAVGGQSGFGGEEAVLLRLEGDAWAPIALPPEVEGLSNLFKVHHDGTDLWMVGFQGVALRGDGQTMAAVPTGTAADLVTANRPVEGGPLVVVGGRGTGVVAEVDGERLAVTVQTQAGLNGVQVYPSGNAVVVGEAGFSALYDTDSDTVEEVLPFTQAVLHATWGQAGGRMLAVGGNLFTSDDTFLGTILIADAPE